MQQRLPSLLPEPIAFAHRGARAHARENTVEAFELGLRLGANGLESDVWLTADGVPVLDHDGVVATRFRKRPIGEVRRQDLPSFIPTLAELYEACGTAYHLSLDLKGPGTGRRVIDVTTEVAPDLLPRLWLCSPRYQELLDLRGFGARLVDSTRLTKIKEGVERRAATLARVCVAVSGRPYLPFRTEFARHKIGTFDTELVREFFQAFAMNAGITLHVETLYGDNAHHVAESCFKGLARALRAALDIDPRRANEIPSTKGVL